MASRANDLFRGVRELGAQRGGRADGSWLSLK
jgi:hypothetical protein